LRDLEKAGDVVIVDHVGDDIEEQASIIATIDRAGLLPAENAIGVDPVDVGQILDALAALGIDNSEKRRIVGVSQGWQLTRAIKTLERHLAGGSFVHGGAAPDGLASCKRQGRGARERDLNHQGGVWYGEG
jgi:phage terminase large subunit-like protein